MLYLAKQSGKQIFWSTASFELHLNFIYQPDCQPACQQTIQSAYLLQDPVQLGVKLQIFHMICASISDLWICCSTWDSSTAPSNFLLSITGLPSSLFHLRGEAYQRRFWSRCKYWKQLLAMTSNRLGQRSMNTHD